MKKCHRIVVFFDYLLATGAVILAVRIMSHSNFDKLSLWLSVIEGGLCLVIFLVTSMERALRERAWDKMAEERQQCILSVLKEGLRQ